MLSVIYYYILVVIIGSFENFIAGTEELNQDALTTESTERSVPVLPLFRVFRAFSGSQTRLPKINFEFWDRFSIKFSSRIDSMDIYILKSLTRKKLVKLYQFGRISLMT